MNELLYYEYIYIKIPGISIVAAAAISLLAACDVGPLSDKNYTNPVRISAATGKSASSAVPFQTVLAAEYKALAQKKRRNLDISDYSHFRDKAAAAARGEKVEVDPPDSRDLKPADSTRLSTARSRLDNLPREIYSAFPRDAARAQVAFDCWFEELADNHEGGDCEARLNDLLAQLECPGGCQEEPQGGDVVKSYDVLFALNSADLQPSAKAVVLQAAATIQEEHPAASVTVSGHADRAGNSTYNSQLAQKRAEAVAAMMREYGVPRALITVESMGERSQAVVTDDDMNLEGNRRVVISIVE